VFLVYLILVVTYLGIFEHNPAISNYNEIPIDDNKPSDQKLKNINSHHCYINLHGKRNGQDGRHLNYVQENQQQKT
jgi:hypothetical protein